MAGVTDSPFRQMIAEIGKFSSTKRSEGGPDLFFTEFVSTEHIARVDKTPLILKYSKKEKPIIAQFFGCKPEQFRECAKLALKLGFDGIDINLGCPDRKVLKQGAGSELIKNPKLAVEIIRAVKKVVGKKIPVSVKTRIGYDRKDFNHILAIAKEGVDAITIHGRTIKQGYSGSADWEAIGEITKEIKKINPNITVIGNGDVKSLEQGKLLAKQYGVDGVMIGREILHNPWVFCRGTACRAPTVQERFKLCLKHTELFEKFYGKEANIGAMKKYYKAYLSGFEQAGLVRKELMEVKNIGEAKKILKRLLKGYPVLVL